MIRLFARRENARRPPKPCVELAACVPDDPDRKRARRRARPGTEMLDERVLMSSGPVSSADSVASPDLADRVAAVVQPYLEEGQFPGLSVAVVTDGQVALAQGYGTANVATHSPVEADTRFDIGSVTKTFTALGVLLLYQDSQGTSRPLNLDAPISDYLHNTRSFTLPHKWAQVTTRELLDMTSGIRNVGTPQPWEAQLKSVAHRSLIYPPGTAASYSNADYYLLGELIEQWTGENYGAFIQKEVLDPLGMSDSEELGGSATVHDQAVGYGATRGGKWTKAPMQNGPELYAAAGIVSTAQDMAKYMTALLSGAILSPATYALMWTSSPAPAYGVTPTIAAGRGPGWDTVIDTSAGPVETIKGGQVPGFTSELVLFPNTDSGVYVSFNSLDRHGVSGLQVAEAVYAAAEDGFAPGT